MNKIKIPYINLAAQWKEEEKDILPIIKEVFAAGQFVGGHLLTNLKMCSKIL